MYSEYLWDFLNKKGCKTAFIVTGGYCMYLHDSLSQNKNFNIIVNHHEQGAIYAAIGYAKLNKDIPVVCVTSGCGLTNTITGLVDCWQDSVPIMVICGQSNSIETINYNKNYKGRNFSGQDVDIESLTRTITKYSKEINNADEAVFELQKAFFEINNGRKEPSVLSIPLDIQRCTDFNLNNQFSPKITESIISSEDKLQMETIINNSERPIIIAGNGIKLSGTKHLFNNFINKSRIPVVTTFLGTDVITFDNDLYSGKIGIMGKRNGNFAVQNADLIFVLGARLPISVVGYQYKLFSRYSKILVIDIDKNEHLNKPYDVDYLFEYDLSDFFEVNLDIKKDFSDWAKKCLKWKKMWEEELPPQIDDVMNPYHVIEKINSNLNDQTEYNILTNGGTNFYITWQTLKIKKNINFLTSASQGDLGWEIPASIGAYLCNKKNTICICGEGSFQFNIQELETIRYNKLPVLILVINNNIYSAIEITQRNFFKRYIGIDNKTGISIPSFENIAKTYNFEYMLVESYDQIKDIFNNPNVFKKPIICNIIVSNQERYPKMSTFIDENNKLISLPFEDMYPFLTEEQLKEEMIVELSDLTIKRLNILKNSNG